MKRIFRYAVALLAAILLVTALLGMPISATQAEADDLGTAGERLDANSQKIYLFFREQVEAIVTGQTTEAFFVADEAEIASWGVKHVWTNTDFGVAGLEEAHMGEIINLFWQQFDLSAVMDALLHDHPFEMFWFDKTSGLRNNNKSGMTGSNGVYDTAMIREIGFAFTVAPEYRAANYDVNQPEVDAQKIASAYAVLENARTIVAQHAEKSDYEKLKAYSETICEWTSYNDEAADPSYQGGYGNAWQAVYVFDGLSETEVVCEGYAKAFQTLCDLSTFRGDVQCYTVSGVMTGGKGAGNHMWNVVCIGSKSYIVDVTNSDAGAVGANGDLFLAGYDRQTGTGFGVQVGQTEILFEYDSDTMALWGVESDSALMISDRDYEPTEIEVAAARPLIYTGTAITVGAADADILYSCQGGESLTELYNWSYQWYREGEMIAAPVDAGTYQLHVTAVNRTNPGDYSEVTVSVTVEKATPTYEVPTGLTATYGDLLSSVALPQGYAWKTPDATVGAAGAAEATVVYTPANTKNYNTVEVAVSIAVQKAMPTYTLPTNLTATYGAHLSDVVLPSGFAWQETGDLLVGDVGERSFLATFTPNDPASYLTVSDIAITLTVLPLDISNAEVTLGDTLTYNGETLTQAVASVRLNGMDVTFTVSGNVESAIGVYTLTVMGTGNFAGSTTAQWRISPDLSSLDSCKDTNVKSTDRDALEAVIAALAGQEQAWQDVLDTCQGLLTRIEQTAQELDEVIDMAAALDAKTITSEKKVEVELALARVDQLLRGDLLTAEERASLHEAKANLDACMERIAGEQQRMMILIGGGAAAVLLLLIVTVAIARAKKKSK